MSLINGAYIRHNGSSFENPNTFSGGCSSVSWDGRLGCYPHSAWVRDFLRGISVRSTESYFYLLYYIFYMLASIGSVVGFYSPAILSCFPRCARRVGPVSWSPSGERSRLSPVRSHVFGRCRSGGIRLLIVKTSQKSLNTFLYL